LKEQDDEGETENSDTNQETDPQRRQHPYPGPGYITSQFETDKQHGQQTRETDTRGRGGGVARHGCFVDVVIIRQKHRAC